MFRFDAAAERMADGLLGYVRDRLRLDPVPLDGPLDAEELERRAPSLIDEDGHDPDEVLAVFRDVIAPSVISADSWRHLAMIPAAPTKASMLFDAVVGASSLNAISWLEGAGAVHAENQVLAWLAGLAGLGPEAGGCFVSGGSAANLSALVVARDVAARQRPHTGGPRALVSSEVHSSVGNALHIIGVEPVVVPAQDGRLTGAAVAAAVRSEPDPDRLCAVVATAGTTNAGVVDDLAGIGEVARGAGLWFHVDGAYGGAALLVDEVRPAFAGVEGADSFVVDPHKWLFAPFDCAALLYRRPQLARAVHTQHADYLSATHDRPAEWNPADYAFHLTRRARGLALWYSLSVHGAAAYRSAVRAAIDLAAWTAERVAAHAHLELVRPPDLSIVLIRRPGWTDEDHRRWSRRLLEEGTAFVAPTRWGDETVARLAFLHPETPRELVEQVLVSMR